jgi:hypothetical protein
MEVAAAHSMNCVFFDCFYLVADLQLRRLYNKKEAE